MLSKMFLKIRGISGTSKNPRLPPPLRFTPCAQQKLGGCAKDFDVASAPLAAAKDAKRTLRDVMVITVTKIDGVETESVIGLHSVKIDKITHTMPDPPAKMKSQVNESMVEEIHLVFQSSSPLRVFSKENVDQWTEK